MSDEPNIGLALLIAAKVVCCAGLLLFATGALTGIGAWLAEGGFVWIAGAALATVALVFWLRRRKFGVVAKRIPCSPTAPEAPAR